LELGGCFEEGWAKLGFADGAVLQEAGYFWLFEKVFFEGDGGWDGAEAFSYAGGSAVHGGEVVFEGVDGPP
jgi:hypothetical protein